MKRKDKEKAEADKELEFGEDKQSEKLPVSSANNSFWDDIEFNPDFPSIEEIRKIAWPKRSW